MVATRYRNFNSDSLLYFWVACCYHRYHHGYPLDTTEQPQVRGPGGRGVDRLAERAGVSRKYLDQILQGFQGKRDKNPRRVGDALAGKISLGLGLHDSWMDQPHPDLWRALGTTNWRASPRKSRPGGCCPSAMRGWAGWSATTS